MGFWGSIGNRVRGALRWDKEKVVLNLAKGGTASSYPSTGFDLLQAYGYDVLSDYLKLEHDLMSRYVDYEEMDDYPELACLAGDSLIFTMEDGWIEIQKLAERGGEFHVLSYDKELRSLVPALATGAILSGKEGHGKPMVKVMLDDGSTVRCTTDHPFLTKDEQWVFAGNLIPGDRLMPGVTRLRQLNGTKSQDYWQVHQPQPDSQIRSSDGKRWIWMHRLVGESLLNAQLGEGDIVHHRNHDPLDNRPSNLEVVDCSGHAQEHIAKLDNSKYLPEWTEKRRLSASKRMRGNTHRRGKKASEAEKSARSKAMSGRVLSEEHKRKIGDAHQVVIERECLESAWMKGGTVAKTARILGVSWSKAKRELVRQDLIADGGNHRVVCVESIHSEPVYDLEVPGFENFVCNGVVVHNTAIDIYADDATQIDSLQNRTLWVDAPDKTVKAILTDLYEKRLRMDEEAWSICRTLVKYGNNYEELLVAQNGVVGTNFLPPPTMRRIEGRRGELFGFVQDFKGRFGYSPDEFKQLLTQRMGSQSNRAFDKYAALEDWEVVHMRLRSKHRRAIYGFSTLEPARWIWKRLMLLEDAAMIYRLQRAPERYAFYVDVGDMPPKEAMAHLHKVRQQYRKTKFYNPQCLTGETCVTLLDGTDKSMAELARDYADKEFDVFSYDLETGKVVPGKASKPRLTHEQAPIWRVVLDNGAVVRSTGNHPFLMRDGKYRAANMLEAGDSLMPLYMSRGSEGTQGYWMYQEPKTGERRPVHKMVAELMDPDLAGMPGIHVHHRDLNKANNAPGNLELLTASEHAKKHPERCEAGRRAFVKRIREDAEFKESISKRLEDWRQNNPEEAQIFFSEHGKEVMAKRKALAADGHAALLELISSEVVRDPLVVADELVERLNENPVFVEIYGALPTTRSPKLTAGCLFAFLKRQGFSGFKDFKRKKTGDARWANRTYGGQKVRGSQPRNHKVVSVTFEGYEDVYNMDVDKYSNFALTSGVFVHNTGKLDLKFNPLSQDEDFFLPIRKGVQGSKIEVLSGPNWQHMDDINYFRLKLFASIKVPKAYLGYEEARGKATGANDDVRFARTVLRTQRELRNGLSKIGRVHLAALGINPAAVEYQVYMTVPSSIFELAQLEVRNAKADFAGRMSQFVSLHWILQKIFGLSEEDISFVLKERHKEALQDAEVQAKAMGMQLDVQNSSQAELMQTQMKMQGQQAVAGAVQAPPGTKKAEDAYARLRDFTASSRLWSQIRQGRDFRPITEQELFTGNREHERKMEEQLGWMQEHGVQQNKNMKELGGLLRELAHTRSRPGNS